ncbi:MAG: ribose-5-phosphate isomerase RpiA [Trueperaceae bacterium]
MSGTAAAAEEQKMAAAIAASELIDSDSVIGLGTGSTVRYLIEELGRRLADGRLERVHGVATSVASERLAAAVGIPLVELPEQGVALAIDGMDEVDSRLQAIKGLGGALAREKIVAASAASFVLVGDAGKRVERLAERTPVPVEVLSFGWRRTAHLLEELGLEPRFRRAGETLFTSDNGNPILDCRVRLPADLDRLAESISLLPGVVEHGLFLDHAEVAFVAGSDGVEELRRRA